MTVQQQHNILSSLVDGLKLKHGDLAMLVETLSHQSVPYDFFRTLATLIISFISSLTNTQNRVILYTAADGKVMANVLFANDTFWLTQSVMSELFGVKTPAISKHLKNIYESKELIPEATVSKMEIVQMEGERRVTREVEVYNLDAVIAVGYRVNSIKATHLTSCRTNFS